MCRSEFFLKYLPIADGLLDVGKKRILAAADLVIERQETTPLIRATAEAGPIGALPAEI